MPTGAPSFDAQARNWPADGGLKRYWPAFRGVLLARWRGLVNCKAIVLVCRSQFGNEKLNLTCNDQAIRHSARLAGASPCAKPGLWADAAKHHFELVHRDL